VEIKNVSSEITAEDVIQYVPELQIKKAWRIISRKTHKPTSLIRIVTDDEDSLDKLLMDGIELYGHVHKCETLHFCSLRSVTFELDAALRDLVPIL
jgi:hypothetical protein